MRLLRYTQAFGPSAGARLFAQTLLPVERVELRVPGYGSPLVLRPGSSDVPTFGQIFVSGEYDFDLGALSPRVIVDAGANVGYSTVYLAKRFPEARIVALEPERTNFEILVENTAAWPRVTPLRKALWSGAGRLQIENPDDQAWEFRVRPTVTGDDAAHAVEAVTVQELLALLEVDTIDLLKLDIEGAEREVFGPGCQAWLGHVRAIVVELHDRYVDGCAQTFYRAIADLDYTHQVRGENTCIVRR